MHPWTPVPMKTCKPTTLLTHSCTLIPQTSDWVQVITQLTHTHTLTHKSFKESLSSMHLYRAIVCPLLCNLLPSLWNVCISGFYSVLLFCFLWFLPCLWQCMCLDWTLPVCGLLVSEFSLYLCRCVYINKLNHNWILPKPTCFWQLSKCATDRYICTCLHIIKIFIISVKYHLK